MISVNAFWNNQKGKITWKYTWKFSCIIIFNIISLLIKTQLSQRRCHGQKSWYSIQRYSLQSSNFFLYMNITEKFEIQTWPPKTWNFSIFLEKCRCHYIFIWPVLPLHVILPILLKLLGKKSGSSTSFSNLSSLENRRCP